MIPDIDVLRSDIRLRRRAKELGKQNQPTTEDKRKDSIASDVDLNLEQTLKDVKHQLAENLAAIERIIVSGVDKSRTAIQDIESCTQKILENLYADSKTSVGAFWRIKNDHCIADTDFEAFRLKNKLTHLPIYPESPTRLWAIIFFLFTLEICLNTWTLGSAHPEGYFGVVMETCLISAINIGIGICLGFFFIRELHHNSPFRKFLVGIICTIIFCAFLIGFNILIGHYRDALLAAQSTGSTGLAEFLKALGQVGPSALRAFLEHPLEMQEIKSYLTTLVGGGLAIIAAYEAFKLDDKYPAYGRLHRTQKKESKRYNQTHDQVLNSTVAIGGTGRKAIVEIIDNVNAADQTKANAAIDKAKLIQDYENWVGTIKTMGETLYAEYREIALAERTDPHPECFNIEFNFPDTEITTSETVTTTGVTLDLLNTHRDIQEKRINDAIGGYLRIYEDIHQLAPESALGKMPTEFEGRVDQVHDDAPG